MIIYLAGNTGTSTRDKQLVDYGANRLFSFFYHGSEGHFFGDWQGYLREVENNESRSILSSPCSH